MGKPHQPMIARAAEGGGTATPPADPEQPPFLEDDADPDAVVDEVLSLLGKERFRSARSLAAEALARFADHARVRRAWGIFCTAPVEA